jgi:tetratricopeptide (TPR) repeat protein
MILALCRAVALLCGIAALVPVARAKADGTAARTVPSDPSPTLLAALEAERALDPARALELFKAADRERPGEPFILQKIAKQYSDSIADLTDRDAKRAHARQAILWSQRAAELAPDDAVIRLSIAISYGKLALFSDTRTKVETSRRVKEEAERAIALDPEYDWAYHVLGRWHMEAAAVGSTARFFARLIYGGIPAASYEEAVRLFEKAVQLAPENLAHRVELGIAYAQTGRSADARRELERALAAAPRERYEIESQERARRVLADLGWIPAAAPGLELAGTP